MDKESGERYVWRIIIFMRWKHVLLIIGLGLAAIVLLVAAFFFWMADPFELRSPKDQTLIDLFHNHHEAFEQIKEMVSEDASVLSVFSDSTLKNSQLDKSRQTTYQHLFATIDSKLVASGDDGRVNLIFSQGEILTIGPGWVKGIAYLPNGSNRDGVTSQNLNHLRTKPAGVYLRQIEPKWFLFYQRDE